MYYSPLDVAKAVFDRCYETVATPDDPNYKITFDFEFLEDFDKYDICCLLLAFIYISSEDTSSGALDNSSETITEDKWPERLAYSSKNHCLHILVSYLQHTHGW